MCLYSFSIINLIFLLLIKLNGNFENYIKTKSFSFQYSLDGLSFGYGEKMGIKLDGYTPIGIVGYTTGNSAILSAQFGIFGEQLAYWFRNVTGNNITAIFTVTVMFVKNL